MNITREKLGDLDLCIKVEMVESDYSEAVSKQLKEYRRKANVPGFRKGMAPMSLIQRMYKSAVVAEEVQNKLNESLFTYLEEEKLDVVGYPMANEEKTPAHDFEKGTDFTFYFDAALMPEVKIDWGKVDAKLYDVKPTEEDVDRQIKEITGRFGKFETPETVGEDDQVYGNYVELSADGTAAEDAKKSFAFMEMKDVAADTVALFLGKKSGDKVVFNPTKALAPELVQRFFNRDAKIDGDVEFTISDAARVIPAELNQELFDKAFPNTGIDSEEKFRAAVAEHLAKEVADQAKYSYVAAVRKQLLDNFDAPVPEAFLKRWVISRSKEETPEAIEAKWESEYVPSMKMEFIDAALEKIGSIEPTQNEIVDYVKGILSKNGSREEGETDEQMDARYEKAARSIAEDEQNVRQIRYQIHMEKSFVLFNDQLKPVAETVTLDEFAKKA